MSRLLTVPSPNYDMADQLLNGQLPRILIQYRDDGLSLNKISQRLYSEHGVSVSVPTVKNWLEWAAEAVAS